CHEAVTCVAGTYWINGARGPNRCSMDGHVPMAAMAHNNLVYRTGYGAGTDLPAAIAALTYIVVQSGHCDLRTIERGRRVAAENGQRLDRVLLQLGLVSERGLVSSYAP